MRIVQTFWTAGKDPLEESFGWAHPEYNLMSWAVSCLSLRKHYDEVALYTDSIGKHVLIDLLHLPYTEVNVVFDDFECLPHHWALAKIYTYSLQKKAFIHVDGDVYLSKALDKELLSAPLIVQNKEIGTCYYQNMLRSVIHNPNMVMPECIRKTLKEDSLSSHNMGVFGGTDLSFINRYCKQAYDFVHTNGLNEKNNINAGIECNIFFEQIILASMTDNEGINVSTIVNHQLIDIGYTISEFCNLSKFDDAVIHHLLGGHKRNKIVYNMLKHYYILNYKGCFVEMVNLLYSRRQKEKECQNCHLEGNSHIDKFIKYANSKLIEWRKNRQEDEIQFEILLAKNSIYLDDFIKNADYYELCCVPSLEIYSFGETLESKKDVGVFECFHCDEIFPLKDVAITRSMVGDTYAMEPLIETDMGIISAIRNGRKTLKDVFEYCIPQSVGETTRQRRCQHIKIELSYLIKNEIIYIEKITN